MYVCAATFGSIKKTDVNPNEGTPPTGNPVSSKISRGLQVSALLYLKLYSYVHFLLYSPDSIGCYHINFS
jgi:hypothetical protein